MALETQDTSCVDNQHNNEPQLDTSIDSKDNASAKATVSNIEAVRSNLEAFEQDSLSRISARDKGEDGTKWITGPHKNGVQAYYARVVGSSWNTIKSITRVKSSVKRAVEFLTEKDSVPRYDEMTRVVQVLERLGSDTEVRLVSAKSLMFTSARDFCVATTVRREGGDSNRILIATRSVDHPGGRDRKGYVRAISMISGYIVAPIENAPGECDVTLLAHMDLGGMMPPPVINFLGLSAPIKLLSKLKELLEEESEDWYSVTECLRKFNFIGIRGRRNSL